MTHTVAWHFPIPSQAAAQSAAVVGGAPPFALPPVAGAPDAPPMLALPPVALLPALALPPAVESVPPLPDETPLS